MEVILTQMQEVTLPDSKHRQRPGMSLGTREICNVNIEERKDTKFIILAIKKLWWTRRTL